LIAVGDDLRKGVRSSKRIVQFDDEELTEEKIANKTKQTLKYIDKIAKLLRNRAEAAAKLDKTLKSKKRSYIARSGRCADACGDSSPFATSISIPSRRSG